MATQITFTLINQSEKIILIETYVDEVLTDREVHLGQALTAKKVPSISDSIAVTLGNITKIYKFSDILSIFGNTPSNVLDAIARFYYPWD